MQVSIYDAISHAKHVFLIQRMISYTSDSLLKNH